MKKGTILKTGIISVASLAIIVAGAMVIAPNTVKNATNNMASTVHDTNKNMVSAVVDTNKNMYHSVVDGTKKIFDNVGKY